MKDPAATATERVGRYQLLEPIGIGPNGTVARAKVFGVAGFERQFAIKRFAPELTVLSAHAQALSAAARSYGSLEHPRIARMNEFGVAQGQTFTAVELVPGLDAMRLLAESKLAGSALATGGVLAVISQAARAVGYAHGRGISHLGLAPTNVIITVEGDVKVTDFGMLAATLPQRPIDTARLAKRIAYLAPEQLAGEAVSAASDVFALGVLAYELIGGQPVFRGDSPRAIAEAILAGPPPDPMLPRPIVRVLQRCLARSPFERFPDARALADALDAALRVAPVPGTRRDIGAQVKAALDRISTLHDGQMSGMLALDIGTGPGATAVRDSRESIDVATTEFVRPDVPVAGPAPLVGPGRGSGLAQRGAESPGSTIPELPKANVTVTGLAPPPIPVPPGLAVPPVPPIPPPTATTLVGMPSIKRPQGPPAIPNIVPRVPAAVPAVPPVPARPGAAGKPAQPRGMTKLLDELDAKPPQARGMTNVLDQLDEDTDADTAPDEHATLALPGSKASMTTDENPTVTLPGPATPPPGPISAEMPTVALAGASAHAALDDEYGSGTLPGMGRRSRTAVAADIAKGIEEEIAQDERMATVMESSEPEPDRAKRVEPSTTEIPPIQLATLARAASATTGDLSAVLGDLQPPSVVADMPVNAIGRASSPEMVVAREPEGEVEGDAETVALPQARSTPVPLAIPVADLSARAARVTTPERGIQTQRALLPVSEGQASGPTIGANVLPPPPKKRRWPLSAGIVVLVCALGAGGWYGWTQLGSPSEPVAVGKPVATEPGHGSKPAAGSASQTRAGSATTQVGSATQVATGSGSGSGSSSPAAGSATQLPAAGSAAGSAATKPSVAATAPSADLQIASKPAGARVYLDGADQGVTPLKLPGTNDHHSLALFAPGYDVYLADVDGHGQFTIAMKAITPLAGPAGIKVIRCKKERYYVYVDGQPTGMTCPTERIHVDMGPHTVEVYDLVTEARQKWDIDVKETRLSFRVRVEN